jgi:CRP-like cAMP-binding protein
MDDLFSPVLGRAPRVAALQAGGHRFDPGYAPHENPWKQGLSSFRGVAWSRVLEERLDSGTVLRAERKIELLRHVPLFSGCSRRDLVLIARASDEMDFKPGRVLIKEGSAGREFFVLTSGSVDVKRKGKKIDTLGTGDFFGEASLLTDGPRNATVTTTSDVQALVLTKHRFRQVLGQNPLISFKVMQALAERLPDR